MGINKAMLPANVSGRDMIQIEERVRKPIPAVRVDQGARLIRRADTASPDYNDREVKSSDGFPKVRGW